MGVIELRSEMKLKLRYLILSVSIVLFALSKEAFTSTFVDANHQSKYFTFEAHESFGRSVGGADVDKGIEWKEKAHRLFEALGKEWDSLAAKDEFRELFGVLERAPKEARSVKGSRSFSILMGKDYGSVNSIEVTYSPKGSDLTKQNAFFAKAYLLAQEIFSKMDDRSWKIDVREEHWLLKNEATAYGSLVLLVNYTTNADFLKSPARKKMPAVVGKIEAAMTASPLLASKAISVFAKRIDQLELTSSGLQKRWHRDQVSHGSCEDDPNAKSECDVVIVSEGDSERIILSLTLKPGHASERKKMIQDLTKIVKTF